MNRIVVLGSAFAMLVSVCILGFATTADAACQWGNYSSTVKCNKGNVYCSVKNGSTEYKSKQSLSDPKNDEKTWCNKSVTQRTNQCSLNSGIALFVIGEWVNTVTGRTGWGAASKKKAKCDTPLVVYGHDNLLHTKAACRIAYNCF